MKDIHRSPSSKRSENTRTGRHGGWAHENIARLYSVTPDGAAHKVGDRVSCPKTQDLGRIRCIFPDEEGSPTIYSVDYGDRSEIVYAADLL